ncbi:MAG TPA: hypothetical protein PKD00_01465 [Burkholderiales bacterium]|nr:hypothetical protein [Burkholderiales bacterium]
MSLLDIVKYEEYISNIFNIKNILTNNKLPEAKKFVNFVLDMDLILNDYSVKYAEYSASSEQFNIDHELMVSSYIKGYFYSELRIFTLQNELVLFETEIASKRSTLTLLENSDLDSRQVYNGLSDTDPLRDIIIEKLKKINIALISINDEISKLSGKITANVREIKTIIDVKQKYIMEYLTMQRHLSKNLKLFSKLELEIQDIYDNRLSTVMFNYDIKITEFILVDMFKKYLNYVIDNTIEIVTNINGAVISRATLENTIKSLTFTEIYNQYSSTNGEDILNGVLKHSYKVKINNLRFLKNMSQTIYDFSMSQTDFETYVSTKSVKTSKLLYYCFKMATFSYKLLYGDFGLVFENTNFRGLSSKGLISKQTDYNEMTQFISKNPVTEEEKKFCRKSYWTMLKKLYIKIVGYNKHILNERHADTLTEFELLLNSPDEKLSHAEKVHLKINNKS